MTAPHRIDIPRSIAPPACGSARRSRTRLGRTWSWGAVPRTWRAIRGFDHAVGSWGCVLRVGIAFEREWVRRIDPRGATTTTTKTWMSEAGLREGLKGLLAGEAQTEFLAGAFPRTFGLRDRRRKLARGWIWERKSGLLCSGSSPCQRRRMRKLWKSRTSPC